MRRTAIIGLGITGFSCVKYLHGREQLMVLDTRSAPPMLAELTQDYPDVEVQLGATDFDPEGFDRAIISPGVSLDSCLLARATNRVRFDSDIDLFCDAASAPVIAITGTNGKSTVTDLTGHLLNSTGRHVPVGGNLGSAALDLLDEDADAYVVELSSFQLERLRTHHFAAAALLNLSEDHLDRHGDMATYLASKQLIYRDCAVALANRNDARTLPEHKVGQLVTFGDDAPPAAGDWGVVERDGQRLLACGERILCSVGDLSIAGRHNELNALAACALAMSQGAAFESLAEPLRRYPGLPHRAQRVLVADQVDYINDSKATNVGATLAALSGFGDPRQRRVILIAGGDGKGADFSALRDSTNRYVKALIVLGADAPALQAALADCAPTTSVNDMAAAVRLAHEQAEPGDVVLLSPACASFDMYSGFAARGEDFAEQVTQVVR